MGIQNISHLVLKVRIVKRGSFEPSLFVCAHARVLVSRDVRLLALFVSQS